MKYCPCDKSKRYLDCCGAYLQTKAIPITPEQLMRSRYTAYVEGRMDYIKKTMRGPALLLFNKKTAQNEPDQWLGLEVISSFLDPNNADIGYVKFIAKYQINKEVFTIQELSEFHRVQGKWYYVDGKQKS